MESWRSRLISLVVNAQVSGLNYLIAIKQHRRPSFYRRRSIRLRFPCAFNLRILGRTRTRHMAAAVLYNCESKGIPNPWNTCHVSTLHRVHLLFFFFFFSFLSSYAFFHSIDRRISVRLVLLTDPSEIRLINSTFYRINTRHLKKEILLLT